MVREIVIVVLCTGAVVVAINFTGCSERGSGDLAKGERMPAKTIEQVQEEHTDEWMAIPGVEGMAIGLYKGKPCIKIFASVEAQELRGRIPPAVEDYPVIIEETGVFRALDEQ